MNKPSVLAAERELSSAKASLTSLRQASDLKDVHRLWSDFLIHANRVFAKLEQGAKATPSQPWYGQVIHERRTDPLLQYIHKARDASEHGDALSGKDVILHGIEARTSQFFTADGLAANVSAGSSFSPRRLYVLSVTTRSVTYLPPRSHLGKPIYPAVETIAGLTIDYLTRLVDDARTRMIS